MKRNTFFKTVATLASTPVIVSAMTAAYQQPTYALSTQTATLTTAQATIQAIEIDEPTTSIELASRYQDHSFELINSQSRSMYYFYASPSDVSTWEEDLLGSSTLSSYSSAYVNIDDNRSSCFYDFKAVFSDGAETTHYDINICDLASYTF